MRFRTHFVPIGIALTLLASPEAAEAREKIDTTFDHIEEVGSFRLLFTGDEASYKIPDKVWNYDRYQPLWITLKKGARIHIIVEGDTLRGIFNGWRKKVHINSKILESIRGLKEGTIVRVNGEQYQYVSRDKTHLTVLMKLPGGDFGYASEKRIEVSKIKKIAIVTKEEVGELGGESDILDMFGVEEADTVELTLGDGKVHKGAVLKMTPINLDLLPWVRGEYGEAPIALRRREVTKVVHRPLESEHSYSVGEGSLSLTIRRFRRKREGKTRWDIELSHNAPLALLQPFMLTFNLTEALNDKDGATAVGTERVAMLFPNRTIKFTHTAIHERYVDATIDVPELVCLPYSSAEAEETVLRAIETSRNKKRLTGLYAGRMQSQDPAFLHLLISRTLIPLVGRAGAEIHMELAHLTLLASGEAGAEAITHELGVADNNLEITRLIDGDLARASLPEKEDRDEWRKKLLRLLKNQEGALAGGRAMSLFDFYCEHEQLSKEVEELFFKFPAETVKALFETAIPREGKRSKRTRLAGTLLRNLKGAALDSLRAQLQERKINATEFLDARAKYGNAKAEKAVDVALALAGEASREEWLAELNEQVKAAKEAHSRGKDREAMAALRAILKTNPELKSAKAFFPTVAVSLATKMKSVGEAVMLLEEAAKSSSKAKGPLAQFLLDGLKQEIDSTIVHDAPSHGGTVLKRLEPNEVIDGHVNGDWVVVSLPGRKKPAYVHRKCVSPHGDGQVQALEQIGLPLEIVERVAERIASLAPELEVDAQEQLGHAYARDGYALFLAEQYELAEGLLDKAERLAPDDERIGLASSNWLNANMDLMLLVGSFLLAAGLAGFFMFRKIKAELSHAEDLSGQNLEIILELGVDEFADEDEDDDDDDDEPVAAGATASAGAAASA